MATTLPANTVPEDILSSPAQSTQHPPSTTHRVSAATHASVDSTESTSPPLSSPTTPPALPARSPLRRKSGPSLSTPPTPNELSANMVSMPMPSIDSSLGLTLQPRLLARASFASMNRLMDDVALAAAYSDLVDAQAAEDAINAKPTITEEDGTRTSFASSATAVSDGTQSHHRASLDSSATLHSPTDEVPPPLPALPSKLPPLPTSPYAPSFTSDISSGTPGPKIPKRNHALLELLTSERAYAHDLQLVERIHIPLAKNKPALIDLPTPLPSNLSDPAFGSPDPHDPTLPMSADDVKIIFGNIPELTTFSTAFCTAIEGALGSVLVGDAPDSIGALFMSILPTLEPLYKAYITRHATALAHYQRLPQTPQLARYTAQTQALSSARTTAWDLPSFLIKPVQRLLKYPLLLSTVIADTPASHPDKEKLIQAKDRLEAFARDVNEGRRRYEVVKGVLANAGLALDSSSSSTILASEASTAGPEDTPSKRPGGRWKSGKKAPSALSTTSSSKDIAPALGSGTGLGFNVPLGAQASAQLARLRPLRSLRPAAPPHPDEVTVHDSSLLLRSCLASAEALARDALAWAAATHSSVIALSLWGRAFGRTIGLAADEESEAFDAFLSVLDAELIPLSATLEDTLKRQILPELARLVDSARAPLRLLDALGKLEPLHYGLLHLDVAKHRPAASLLDASQSFLALRAQLAAELPGYVKLLQRGAGVCVGKLSKVQREWYKVSHSQWAALWDALSVDGEMRSEGAVEIMRVWRGRWEGASSEVERLGCVRPDGLRTVDPEKRRRIEDRDAGLRHPKRKSGEPGAYAAGGGGSHVGYAGYAVPVPRERSRNRQHQSVPTPLQTEHIPQMPMVSNMLGALAPAHASGSTNGRGRHDTYPAAGPRSPSPSSRRDPLLAPSAPRSQHRIPSAEYDRESTRSWGSGGSGSANAHGRPERTKSMPLRESSRGAERDRDREKGKDKERERRRRDTDDAKISPTLDDYAAGALGRSSRSTGHEPLLPAGSSHRSLDDHSSRHGSEKDKDKDRGRKPSFRRKVSGAFSMNSVRKTSRPRRLEDDELYASIPPAALAQFEALGLGGNGLDFSIPGVAGTFSSPGSGHRPHKVQTHAVSVPSRALYACKVVHSCEPPDGVSYRALPFFHLREGMRLDVLREEGHPSLHENLPLYVDDDGDDCLLLARDKRGNIGWALASFLVPMDF